MIKEIMAESQDKSICCDINGGGHRDMSVPVRILIADSNRLFRELIKLVISDHFAAVVTSEAVNEQEVFDELRRHVFDVLLLDLDLSGNQGVNALKKIMSAVPDLPVVVMSLFPDDVYEENIFRAGYSGYVSKVNLARDLITALRAVIHGNGDRGAREADPGYSQGRGNYDSSS